MILCKARPYGARFAFKLVLVYTTGIYGTSRQTLRYARSP